MKIPLSLGGAIGVVALLAGLHGTHTTSPPPGKQASAVTKIMVIVEENHSIGALASMPYLRGLSTTYGHATHYSGVTHPSLGNYLAMVSGQGASTCGQRDPSPSACPQPGHTVFGQTIAAGKTAKTYAETMSSSCRKTSSGNYAPRHNPWVYFGVEAASCAANDVPLGTTSSGALLADTRGGVLPVTGMIVPNLCNDAHDCSLSVADGWLKRWVPIIMAGPDFKLGRLAVIITFDEGSSSQVVPFVVVHPNAAGRSVAATYDHYALARLYDDNAGVPGINQAASHPGLRSSFNLG